MKTVYSADNKIESLRELLPWYITNTLSTEDKKRLEEALQKYDFLREELEQERQLAELLSADIKMDVAVQNAQAEQQKRLDTLLDRIDLTESALLQEADSSSYSQSLKSTVSTSSSTSNSEKSVAQKSPKMGYVSIRKTYFAYAASFAFLLGTAFVLYQYLNPVQNMSNAVYFTSSFKSDDEKEVLTVPSEETNQNILLVSFSQFARHQDISNLLFKVNARIIDGPDQSLTYRIEIKGEPNEKQLKDSMEVLQKNTSIITFVGPAC